MCPLLFHRHFSLVQVTTAFCPRKSCKYRLKSGSKTCLVNAQTKERILTEPSTFFDLEDQQLVFQDGTEIPDELNPVTYTEENDIRYRSRIEACEKLYLLDASEGKGICCNIF